MVLDGTVEKVEAFETRPTDIFLTSFPKSGTTWLQEVVFRLCNQNEDSSEILEDRVPYLEFPYPGIDDISRREGQRLIKSHLPLHLLPKGVWEGQGKVGGWKFFKVRMKITPSFVFPGDLHLPQSQGRGGVLLPLRSTPDISQLSRSFCKIRPALCEGWA